jgi:murein DD-endopeptidase MepM/ murein hydrolase activator NlpD
MKHVKRLIYILVVLIGLTGAYTFYDYTQITRIVPQFKTYTFNGQTINYTSAIIRYHILGGLISFDQPYAQDQHTQVNTDRILHTFNVAETTHILITAPDQSVQTLTGSQAFAFEVDGEYKIELVDSDPDGVQTHYAFSVVVDSVAEVSISNLTPVQGELLVIDLSNIQRNSTISIESPFVVSVLTQQDHTARFYLPIQYRSPATTYPLSLLINDKRYEYTLSVQPFAFKKEYFTVDAEIVNSTAGNPESVTQFRNAITPLYDLVEPEVLHTGNFILPVNGARVSSEFGVIRYINGATTASRHGGIDYAITCGTPVVASNSGLVQYADFLTLTGNTVVIEHGLGLKTVYYHMLDLTIEAGEMVEKGQLIGHVGTTGYSTGCHLHFQAMIKNQPINPDFLYQLFK